MAKTKKKKEELVDLKPEKVTDEQLQKIQGIVDKINQTQMNIGQLEARKHQALPFLAGTNDELLPVLSEFKSTLFELPCKLITPVYDAPFI